MPEDGPLMEAPARYVADRKRRADELIIQFNEWSTKPNEKPYWIAAQNALALASPILTLYSWWSEDQFRTQVLGKLNAIQAELSLINSKLDFVIELLRAIPEAIKDALDAARQHELIAEYMAQENTALTRLAAAILAGTVKDNPVLQELLEEQARSRGRLGEFPMFLYPYIARAFSAEAIITFAQPTTENRAVFLIRQQECLAMLRSVPAEYRKVRAAKEAKAKAAESEWHKLDPSTSYFVGGMWWSGLLNGKLRVMNYYQHLRGSVSEGITYRKDINTVEDVVHEQNVPQRSVSAIRNRNIPARRNEEQK